ncbi:MAG: transcriptional regulator, partial [Rothia mucilaginosa]|nr:transcriptional regulator [Rothia mucilaginosa]
NPALPNGASDSSYGPKVYETYKEAVEEAKKDPSAKKTTNADGNVYTASDGSIAIVEAKNGNYIAVQNNGSWLRVTPEGEVVTVDAKGSWALFKTNGEVAHIDENGATSIVNIKTFEVSTDYQSLEVPKTPAPVGDFPAPKTPVTPSSVATN